MKYLALLLSTSMLLLFACQSKTTNSEIKEEVAINTLSYKVEINGMTCTGCEQTIQNAVNSLDGVSEIAASHTDGNAIVKLNPDKVDTLAIKNKISETGYTVTSILKVE